MKPVYLLDTCIFSEPIKTKPDKAVIGQWADLNERSLAISSITLAEVLQGLEAKQSDVFWDRYRHLLEGRYQVRPFAEPEATLFGKLAGAFRREGRTVLALDLMIACVAICGDMILVTRNTKDFEGIPQLRLDDWGTP